MVLAVCLAVACGPSGCGYIPAPIDKAVSSPRVGRVFAEKAQAGRRAPVGVAVVYCDREPLNLHLALESTRQKNPPTGRLVYHQLVADKAVRPADVFVPAEADAAALSSVHDPAYLKSLNDYRALSKATGLGLVAWHAGNGDVDRILAAARTGVGGTILAAELAAAHGVAVHLGGGFKHAFADHGSRGDILADVPVAVAALRREKLAQKIMIVSLGATQANGIAAILGDDREVYLLDVFEKANYPATKLPETDAVPIPDGLGNSDYMQRVGARLPKALDQFKPDLVFYLAGVDVAAGDPDGRTKLTPDGLLDRDRYVAAQVRERNIPLCVLLDGGRAPGSWRLHYRSIRALLARYGGVPFRPTAAGE